MPKIIAEISFVPLGAGVSLSPYVAEAVRIIRESGLKHEFHSMGTNVEGEWDEVMSLVKRCHDKLFQMGVPRLTTSLKISARQDREPDMEAKKRHVEEFLEGNAAKGGN